MRIGVLTSGGDAPGMNAAVRTVTAVGIARGHDVVGIRRGYEGLLAGDARTLALADVDGIARAGGTVLGSARSAAFATDAGQAQARERLAALGLDALVVIGGNGSLAGAHRLAEGRPSLVVGLPASIDNDVGHTALAIGTDTAVNTIVEACDRISDTARAHRRAFVVEVMGRHCGFLAMRAGIAAEADAILYAESGESEEALVGRLVGVVEQCFAPPGRPPHKTRCLIVKAEGVRVPTARLVERLQAHLDAALPGIDVRATVLGHVVRGGSPTALDRLIAQRLAYAAVVGAEQGLHDAMLGWEPPLGAGAATADASVRAVPLAEVLAESDRLVDGTSPVVKRRLALLGAVQDILAL
jgi:6-phosphofructokinase 1